MPQGNRTRGYDARRLGEFANQFGDRLIGVRARIQQARRARDVSNYIGQVEQDYSDEIASDPSPENVLRRAYIARGRLGQIGSDPLADKSINRFDDEVRSGRAGIAARQPKDRLIDYQDIPLEKGGSRRIARFGTDTNNITRLQEINLSDPSSGITDYQREMLDLRRENKGRGNENDLTNLHLKREQLGKTINALQNEYDNAENLRVTKGTPNYKFSKGYVQAQKKKLQNALDLVQKQIEAKGGSVGYEVRPDPSGPSPLLARPEDLYGGDSILQPSKPSATTAKKRFKILKVE